MARLTIEGTGVWVNAKPLSNRKFEALRSTGEMSIASFARFIDQSMLYGHGFNRDASIYIDGTKIATVESLLRLGALSPNYSPSDHKTADVPSFEGYGKLLIRKQFVEGRIVDIHIPDYVFGSDFSLKFIDDFLDHLGVFAQHYFYLYSWGAIRSAPADVAVKRERIFVTDGGEELELSVSAKKTPSKLRLSPNYAVAGL